MIEEKQKLSGNINVDQELNGDINVATIVIPPSLQEKVATPTTSSQEITADENYNGLSKVTISAVDSTIDNNIQSSNIKKDVTILGVTGEFEGAKISDYFRDSIDIDTYSWWGLVKKIPYFQASTTAGHNKFNNCQAEYINVSGFDISNTTTVNSCFKNCVNLKEIDISMWNTNGLRNIGNLFNGCSSLQKCDVRSIEFTKSTITTKDNVFTGIPSNCLVIVKDSDQKTWVQTNYSNLTNVKTVAEYENQ